jgi:hypothetical protein
MNYKESTFNHEVEHGLVKCGFGHPMGEEEASAEELHLGQPCLEPDGKEPKSDANQ